MTDRLNPLVWTGFDSTDDEEVFVSQSSVQTERVPC